MRVVARVRRRRWLRKDRATRVMVEVRVGDLVYEDRCPRQRDDSDHEGQP